MEIKWYAICTPGNTLKRKILQHTIATEKEDAWYFATTNGNVVRQMNKHKPDWSIDDAEDVLTALGYKCIQVRAIAK